MAGIIGIRRVVSQSILSTRRVPFANRAIRSYASSTTTPAPFSPTTFAPDEIFSTPNVNKMLETSILNEFSKHEQGQRVMLAAAYRLFGLKGWNENIYNHLTAKVKEEDGSESFLINPFGLHYGEVTASSLIKINLDGKILHPGTTGDTFGINEAGFVIHSAIHRARPDVWACMHSHFPPAAGISANKHGLSELTQTGHQVGPVAYHNYNGLVVDINEQKSLVEDIGDKNILFLRNHGVITAAESVGACWYLMDQLMYASQIQVAAAASSMGDPNNLFVPAEKLIHKTYDLTRVKSFSGRPYGQKELAAYMRMLDRSTPAYRN